MYELHKKSPITIGNTGQAGGASAPLNCKGKAPSWSSTMQLGATQNEEENMAKKDSMKDLTNGVKVMGGDCIVEIYNDCPADWQVTIVHAAADFNYQKNNGQSDGSFRDDSGNISVPRGGTTYLRSNDGTKCVQSVNLALWVYYPGIPNNKPQVIGGGTNTDAQHCILKYPVTLGPKSNLVLRTNGGDGIEFELAIS